MSGRHRDDDVPQDQNAPRDQNQDDTAATGRQNPTPSQHEKTDEMSYLAGAYALDALDPTERDEFERHLATCAECTEEVAGFHVVAAELSLLEPVEPPAQLRIDLLERVSQTRPLSPVSTVTPITQAPSRRVTRVWQGVAAACAVIAIAAAVWGFQQRHGTSGNSADQALASVLAAPDSRTVSQVVSGTGQAAVVYSKSRNEAYLIAHGLPAAGAGKTYQAWYIAGKTITSAGLFTPDATGSAIFKATGNLRPVTVFGISLEPAGGSPQPTGTPTLLTLS